MGKKSSITILCSTDDNYVPYCGVMLTSVFENNKNVNVCAYVIIDKPISARNRRKFTTLASTYHQKIEFVMIDNSLLSQFPTKGMSYWTVAMYYRFFAAELLPKNIHKILYLDCDVIVDDSLKDLFDIDLGNKAVGCIPDIFFFSDENQKRLGYEINDGYFNSGVLLINLDYWRENGICQKCLDYLKDNYNMLFANDQDVLNAVLHNSKVNLPITYNYQIQFRKNYFFNHYTDAFKEEILNIKRPIIIHYAAPIKPWNCLYYKTPYKKEWVHYKRLSPWRYKMPQMPPKKKFKCIIKRYILWPLGIMLEQKDILN